MRTSTRKGNKMDINYNELRRLAKKSEKSQPIFTQLQVKDGKAYWTNAIILIEFHQGYEKTPDMIIDLNSLQANRLIGAYPTLDAIIKRGHEAKKPEFKQEVVDGKVVYSVDSVNGPKLMIDEEIINQFKKLMVGTDYEFNIDDLVMVGYVVILRRDEFTIHHTLKRFQ